MARRSIRQYPRPASIAGRLLWAVLALALPLGLHAADAPPATPQQLIEQADRIKTADNTGFLALIKKLDAQTDTLSPLQLDWLAYLKAWQAGFLGDFPTAEASLRSVLARTQDPTLRARTRITLLNDEALASHYEEAYANLSELLESLPQVSDPLVRNYSDGVAALLYNQAGQFDLALKYADQWLAEATDAGACKAMAQKVETLYKIGKLGVDDANVRSGIDACQRIGDPLFANLIRIYQANALLDRDRAADGLNWLKPHVDEVMRTHSAATISNFQALLARIYFAVGQGDKAREAAQAAIDFGIKQAFSKSVSDAYGVLYDVAKSQGDFKAALAYHEKFAEASKGYLSDTTARTLAFQMVNQQLADKKRQIEALNDANQVLQLRQQVDAKSAETSRLYILLLVAVLGSIIWWAWRTKMSQLRFQRLARRDSLTGIFNRQHFLDVATTTLQYAAKSSREICVLIIDLDHFKTINDSHGHATGDLVLKRSVAICSAQLRSVDAFGRLGGEEFGILLADCDLAQAQRRAEALRAAIAALSQGVEFSFPVSASFGLASTRSSGYDLKQLLVDADAALYRAKREGRNRVALCEMPGNVAPIRPLAKSS